MTYRNPNLFSSFNFELVIMKSSPKANIYHHFLYWMMDCIINGRLLSLWHLYLFLCVLLFLSVISHYIKGRMGNLGTSWSPTSLLRSKAFRDLFAKGDNSGKVEKEENMLLLCSIPFVCSKDGEVNEIETIQANWKIIFHISIPPPHGMDLFHPSSNRDWMNCKMKWTSLQFHLVQTFLLHQKKQQ